MKPKDMLKAAKMVLPGMEKMDRKRAIRQAQKNGKQEELGRMQQEEQALSAGGATSLLHTIWGEKILAGYRDYLQEYPRPQLRRIYENRGLNQNRTAHVTYSGEGYFNLNGSWQYAVTKEAAMPTTWEAEILVPFSPETILGGKLPTITPEDHLWYRKMVRVVSTQKDRVLLHFGAVDQTCEIYLNGTKVGEHVGGYLPFTIEITRELMPGDNELVVHVTDTTNTSYHSRGKQKLKPGGMFYHAQSGIWQTVWMETVPKNYIREIRVTPLFEEAAVRVTVFRDNIRKEENSSIELEVLDGNFVIASVVTSKDTIRIPLPKTFHEWTPEDPFLYGLTIRTGSKDRVSSYFAMRTFTNEPDEDGVYRLCLNHKPYFQNGVLSQGYWSDSLLTAPDDEAYIHDIGEMKRLGFNMMRVHCKLESLRFYYHCDRLGMIVWQDMVNGGEEYNTMRVTYVPTLHRKMSQRKDNCYRKLGRASKKGRNQWYLETLETLHTLYNSPCIGTWVLFNEGWGQFDAKKAASFVRRYDESRMIDHASGWFDQGAGDIHSLHRYFEELRVEEDVLRKDRAKVISEYGGIAFCIPGHVYGGNLYSYKTAFLYSDYEEEFQSFQNHLKTLAKEGLSGAVYTQVSDIEEEMNGLLTFDRRVNKIKAQ